MKTESKSNSNILSKAEIFARRVHADQVRANIAREPYTSHLREVAELVKCSGGTDEEIVAAWLHDSIEDTPTTLGEIIATFGAEIGTIVDGLTDPPEFEVLSTLERKTRQAARVRSSNRSVRRVKIADQTSNLRSITVDPPVAWNRQKCLDYIEGARRIAIVCYGIQYLDFEFLKAYHQALQARS